MSDHESRKHRKPVAGDRQAETDGAVVRRIDRAESKGNSLPAESSAALKEIVADLKSATAPAGMRQRSNRGAGTGGILLFTGGAGTVRTLAAEILADELRLVLYRVDLSAVVSRYIGETEKNLERVFRDVERAGAILLFDEADALFGKRTDVKDSHDRYANIEVNYLLERIEEYGGLVVLATNRRENLDPAFIRRLRHVLALPTSDPD